MLKLTVDLSQGGAVFVYCRTLHRRAIIGETNFGRILDVDYGSFGQYHSLLKNEHVEKYVGLDMDLVQQFTGATKHSFDVKYEFNLLNIAHLRDHQGEYFPDGIWNTFILRQRCGESVNNSSARFDDIYGVFAFHYANATADTWSQLGYLRG